MKSWLMSVKDPHSTPLSVVIINVVIISVVIGEWNSIAIGAIEKQTPTLP